MYNLGYTYEYEQDPPNYAKAFTWYSQAARLNHPEALNNIGVMYFNGRGVEQNFKKPLIIIKKQQSWTTRQRNITWGVCIAMAKV
jgi:TPR repeat protein